MGVEAQGLKSSSAAFPGHSLGAEAEMGQPELELAACKYRMPASQVKD